MYYHVAPDGSKTPFSSEDQRAIETAEGRGDLAVRINDVVLDNGTVLRFEVRFGDAAAQSRIPNAPIVQVNLDSGNTRLEGKIELQVSSVDASPGSSPSSTTWAPRWLVLHPDNIVIGTDPSNAGAGAGAGDGEGAALAGITRIRLDNIVGIVPDFSSSSPTVFLLRSAAPLRTYAFHAASRKEATVWITAIISAQHHIHDTLMWNQSKLARRLSVKGDDVDLALPPMMGDPDAIIKQGVLKKVAFMKKVWQARYFVLKQDTLEYYQDATLEKKHGTIEVKNIIGIIPVNGGGGSTGTASSSCASKFAIHSVFPDCVFDLSTDDSDAASDWVAALVAAQLLLQDERLYRLRAAEVLISGAVTGREVINRAGSRFTQYLIELETTEALKKKFVDETFPFPAKKFLNLGDNFGTKFIKARQATLNAFVAKIVGERPFCDHELVRRFFFDRRL
eukprot:gene3490-16326_t